MMKMHSNNLSALAPVQPSGFPTKLGTGVPKWETPISRNRHRRSGLEQDTRLKILEKAKRMPGLSIAEISALASISHSTASYHLGRLLESGMLASTPDGNKVRFFASGTLTEEDRRVLAALQNDETCRVLTAIAQNPQCYRAELTALLCVSAPTVNWHLKRLVGCGLVSEIPLGRNRYLFADKTKLQQAFGSLLGKLAETEYDTAGLVALREACLVSDLSHR